MPRKKKTVEPLEVDLVKEAIPLPPTEKVQCEEHGEQPRVNFTLDGIILGKYCFHCYALSFEKAGLKNYAITIEPIPLEA